MKTLRLLFAISIIAMIASCRNNKSQDSSQSVSPETQALLTKAQSFFKVLPEVAENPENPIFESKIQLGKILYFDTQLSENGEISCNSCHNLNTFGVDNLPTSPGADGTLGTRNSPTVFNAALHQSQFWDGRAKDVEEQAGMPITNPIEMMMPDEDYVVSKVKSSDFYQSMFTEVYPDEEDPITFKNITYAIAAFERTLMTPSKFDGFLSGDTKALSSEELKGLETFISTGCIACHSGPVLGGGPLQKFPLFGSYEKSIGTEKVDKGLYENTLIETDLNKFKPMGLRNIEMTAPYYHDGGVADLETAIKLMGKLELNKDLTDSDVNEIVAFLKTLTSDIPEHVKKAPEELENIYL